MRFEPPTIKERGAVAKLMAHAYEQRQPGQDVKGQAQCPRCRSRVNFTVFPSGLSYGNCVSAGCIRWTQ
ncbi:MAG TPA: hypothetical protein VLJ58_04920 [Ramlibacter sp.]|nr:hypothetical protein [Ramlibacter sp.]